MASWNWPRIRIRPGCSCWHQPDEPKQWPVPWTRFRSSSRGGQRPHHQAGPHADWHGCPPFCSGPWITSCKHFTPLFAKTGPPGTRLIVSAPICDVSHDLRCRRAADHGVLEQEEIFRNIANAQTGDFSFKIGMLPLKCYASLPFSGAIPVFRGGPTTIASTSTT